MDWLSRIAGNHPCFALGVVSSEEIAWLQYRLDERHLPSLAPPRCNPPGRQGQFQRQVGVRASSGVSVSLVIVRVQPIEGLSLPLPLQFGNRFRAVSRESRVDCARHDHSSATVRRARLSAMRNTHICVLFDPTRRHIRGIRRRREAAFARRRIPRPRVRSLTGARPL